jgi:23S rRNA pseudouridine1911/1915/1917 synthase
MTEKTSDEAFAEPEAEPLAFEVSETDAGARLDAFLAARFASVSRTALKRAIEDGDVLVGGRASKPSHKLKAGERVEVELPAPPTTELTPEEIPLDIVYEDADVVVVNKRAGMVVHPAAGVRSGTLANALAYRFSGLRIADCGLRIEESKDSSADSVCSGGQLQDTANPQSAIHIPPSEQSAIRNPQSLRPGIVHRLDRDTSGLVVVAKTAQAHENLSEQFRARTVFKSYVALVHGVVREEKGRVEQPLARDPRKRTRMAVARGGRAALSLWRVRRRFARFTLLDVEIKTGRTHQIRVHLAWMKHPVVGDETYGGGRDKTVTDPTLRARIAALGRQFLHAERLGFHQPRTGVWLGFTAPLPRELSDFLDALEAKRD